jgi:hypothetical protein
VFWDLYEKSIQRWSAVQHEPLWLTRWRTVRATPPGMLATVARQFGANFGIWVARSAGVPVAAIIVLRSGAYAKYWRGAMDKELATRVRANEFLHRLAIEEASGMAIVFMTWAPRGQGPRSLVSRRSWGRRSGSATRFTPSVFRFVLSRVGHETPSSG